MSLELPKQEQKEQIEINNTKSFEKAIQDGRIEEAEAWMNDSFENDQRYQGNEKWLEDRQRSIIDAYLEQENRDGAERIVDATKNPWSQEGRVAKFDKFFPDQPYDKPLLEKQAGETIKEVKDTTGFRQALNNGQLDEARAWLTSVPLKII